MKSIHWALALLCITFGLALSAGGANAQATRTWISGVGDDANPCSRTAPCKTFAGAISKTAAGGIIECLDPGGFGAVTITKSISIKCMGPAEAGMLASNQNAVVVNAASTDIISIEEVALEVLRPYEDQDELDREGLFEGRLLDKPLE